jgi:hypothetical protein
LPGNKSALATETTRPADPIDLLRSPLDAAACPAEELAELYRRRWPLETDVINLNNIIDVDVLDCNTVSGVVKELMVFAIVDNLG